MSKSSSSTKIIAKFEKVSSQKYFINEDNFHEPDTCNIKTAFKIGRHMKATIILKNRFFLENNWFQTDLSQLTS